MDSVVCYCPGKSELKCAAILLAAGVSRRFGSTNKLLSELCGKPLVKHTSEKLRRLDCDCLIAVTCEPRIQALLNGFEIVHSHCHNPKMSDSLSTGISHAKHLGAEFALVALADMPFVEEKHFRRVIELTTPQAAAASTDGQTCMPPACFPSQMFDALIMKAGDNGARKIIGMLPDSQFVRADPSSLFDIDSVDDLKAAQERSPISELKRNYLGN